MFEKSALPTQKNDQLINQFYLWLLLYIAYIITNVKQIKTMVNPYDNVWYNNNIWKNNNYSLSTLI